MQQEHSKIYSSFSYLIIHSKSQVTREHSKELQTFKFIYTYIAWLVQWNYSIFIEGFAFFSELNLKAF